MNVIVIWASSNCYLKRELSTNGMEKKINRDFQQRMPAQIVWKQFSGFVAIFVQIYIKLIKSISRKGTHGDEKMKLYGICMCHSVFYILEAKCMRVFCYGFSRIICFGFLLHSLYFMGKGKRSKEREVEREIEREREKEIERERRQRERPIEFNSYFNDHCGNMFAHYAHNRYN